MDNKIEQLEQEIQRLLAENARLKKFEKSEESYRNIFNATGDTIFIHDKSDGSILDVNEAGCRMYGYSKAEILALDVGRLSSNVPPYSAKEAANLITKSIKEGPQSFDWMARNKKGRQFWVQVDLKFAVIGGNERVIAVVRDIDARKRSEQQIIESEQRYRTLFELSPNGISLQNAQGIILDVNPAFCRFRGYKREELIGQHISIIVPEKDKAGCFENIKKIIGGQDLKHEVININQDGSEAIIELHEKRIMLPDDRWGILSVSEDITLRKKTENALRDSEYRFRSIFEENKAVLLIIDPAALKIIQANAAAETYYGYSFKDLIGMDYKRVAIGNIKKNMKAMAQASGNSFLDRHRLADGRIRDVEIFASPVLSGSKNYIFLIVHDISERRKAEQQATFLANVIEQSVEDVIITDTDGAITYVNPAFCQTTGYSKDETLGQNPRLLKSGKHDDRFYKELWDTISGGEKWQGVFINKRKDESLYYEKAIIFPVKDDFNKIINYVGILRDISYERKLEEQVQQMQKLEAIGTLAGGIAHDFNNLLTVVNGHSELALMRIPKDNKAHRDIISILSAGKRAQKLTNQLLAFSRKQLHELHVTNVNEVIKNLETMMRRLIKEDIRMELELAEDIPYIKADPGQLEQILINLIINARDAIIDKKDKKQKNFIRIFTSVMDVDKDFVESHPGSKPGKHVLIQVSDSGIGIDKDTIQKIFDPFFTTKEVGKGTGLGLSTVYGIVKQNNSYIDVESAPGQGAIFKILWPATPEKHETVEMENNNHLPHRGKGVLMIVEDDPAVREFAVSALAELGYTLHVANDGLQALDMFSGQSLKIDCLITDLIMPGMNGRELSEAIQKADPAVKVIYVSGYTYNHLIHEGSLEEGVNFIQKPYSVRTLSKLIEELISDK